MNILNMIHIMINNVVMIATMHVMIMMRDITCLLMININTHNLIP